MGRSFLVLVWIVACFCAAGADEKKKAPAKVAPAQEELTGCLDQRGEAYVLSGSGMKAEAKLSGKRSPTTTSRAM